MKLEDVPLVIATASGKGGVGKTTSASDLARSFSEMGMVTGLIDADISTPNSAEVVGGESVDIGDQRLADGDSMVPPEVNGIYLISKGHVLPEDVPVLRGARFRAETVVDYIHNVEWPDDTDVVIFDTPPGTGEEIQTIVGSVSLDHAFVITTPHPSSVRDAKKTHEFFVQADVPHTAILNMAYIPSDLVASHALGECDFEEIENVGEKTAEKIGDMVADRAADFDLFGYDDGSDLSLNVGISAVVPYSPDYEHRREAIEEAVSVVLPDQEVEE